MNYKQKLGYMCLGAGILALGIIIGQWGTPDIEAQSNGVFDEITCRTLRVADENGKQAIVLGSIEGLNVVTVLDKQGEKAVSLASLTGGGGERLNSVTVYKTQHNKEGVTLTSSESGNSLHLSGQAGEESIDMLAIEKSNPFILIRNRVGKRIWATP